jgi:hypothetical protein
LALRLLILTAVRSHPLRHLHESQIEGDVWTIPAEAMKGRVGATSDFRVPLSREALAVIEQTRPFARDGFLFPGVRNGVISDMTMSQLMARRGMKERPHGFRSSFRDWVAEATNTPHDVAETRCPTGVGLTRSTAERAAARRPVGGAGRLGEPRDWRRASGGAIQRGWCQRELAPRSRMHHPLSTTGNDNWRTLREAMQSSGWRRRTARLGTEKAYARSSQKIGRRGASQRRKTRWCPKNYDELVNFTGGHVTISGLKYILPVGRCCA